MRTTVTIPDEKMNELLAITEAHSKTQAVNEAIEAYIRRHRLQQLRALKGKVEFLANDELEAAELAADNYISDVSDDELRIEKGKLTTPDQVQLVQLVAAEGEVMVDLPASVIRRASTQVRQQLDDLLGPYARPRPSVTPAQDKLAWQQHLDEKYL